MGTQPPPWTACSNAWPLKKKKKHSL